MAGSIVGWALRLLIIVYLVAMLMLIADLQGWFGSEMGQLARMLLDRLGFPWNRMLSDVPAQMTPWLVPGAPIISIILLSLLSNQFKR
jgi:hypothetical protein